MLTKYSILQVLSASIAGHDTPLMRTAHRAVFDYQVVPGFLYVRSRAISSRTNDNFDTFPADEIEKGYRSFIGKPVFVNHENSNHRRARGVIVDAVLHKDSNHDGSPDTWVEVLMEVDAIRFPKLAEAIVKGEIERTSMGTDVEYSLCSFCGNKAATPMDYCKHIPKLKGRRIRRMTAGGHTEDVLVSEICYGLKFFENSLLVEEPADPTAFFLGVDTRGLTTTAAGVGIHSEIEYDPTGSFSAPPGTCPECFGEGAYSSLKDDGTWTEEATCAACQGSGKKTASLHEAWTKQYQCTQCGKKTTFAESNNGKDCPVCGGPVAPSSGKESHVLRSQSSSNGTADVRYGEFRSVHVPLSRDARAAVHGTGELPQRGSLRRDYEEGTRMSFGGKRVIAAHKHTASDESIVKDTISRLKHLTEYGPDYDRNVTAALSDAQLFLNRGEITSALRFAYMAQMRAGEITFDQFKIFTEGPQQGTFAHKHVGYGEVVAPPQVDTLAPTKCPICGTEEGFNGDECAVCGYLKPPEMFMDPDLEMAQQTDLRQDQKDQNIAGDMLEQTDPNALLECDVCGHSVPDADGVTPGAPGQPPTPSSAGVPPATPQPPSAPAGAATTTNPPGTQPKNPAQDPQAPAPAPSPPGAELNDVPQDPPDPAGSVVPPKPDKAKDSDKPPAGAELPKKNPAPKEDAEQDPASNPNAVDAAPDSDPDKPASQKGDDASDTVTDGSGGKPPVAPGKDDGSTPPTDDDSKPPAADGDDGSKPAPGDDQGDDKSGKTNPDGTKPEDLPAAHEGDPCPSCGTGKLTKAQADAFNQEEDALQSGDDTETQVADDADGGHYPGDTAPGDDQKDDGSVSSDPGSDPSGDDSGSDPNADDEEGGKAKPWPSKKKPSPTDDKSKQEVKASRSPEGVSSMAARPIIQVVAEQQKTIQAQARHIARVEATVNRMAKLAGLPPVTADEKNPADPIPSPGPEAPYSTLEQERVPEARGDVAAIGGVPGATDVGADSTTTVDQIGGINADTPYNISEDVTKPTEGTDGHRPLDEVRTRPRVEFGNPLKPDAAFPLQGEWASKATTGSARTFAALRLARLRIQAGIEEGDDVVVAQRIATDASLSDAVLDYEADVLSRTVTAQARKTASAPTQRRVANAGPATRTVPSVAAGAPGPSLGHTTGAAVSDAEFAFE